MGSSTSNWLSGKGADAEGPVLEQLVAEELDELLPAVLLLLLRRPLRGRSRRAGACRRALLSRRGEDRAREEERAEGGRKPRDRAILAPHPLCHDHASAEGKVTP